MPDAGNFWPGANFLAQKAAKSSRRAFALGLNLHTTG
jgi:hypothetical protein